MSVSDEIREKFRFPKKHEKIVFLVDGEPMKLPPQLQRYMNEKFGKPDPNFTIIKRPMVHKRDGETE